MKMIALYIFSAEVHSKEQKDAIKEWLSNKEIKCSIIESFIVCEFRDLNYFPEATRRELSKAFPSTLFELDTEGGCIDESYKEYYFNGRMQHADAEITYEPFVVDKLK